MYSVADIFSHLQEPLIGGEALIQIPADCALDSVILKCVLDQQQPLVNIVKAFIILWCLQFKTIKILRDQIRQLSRPDFKTWTDFECFEYYIMVMTIAW